MTKRLIGIEITAQYIRMAIFTNDKEHPNQFKTLEHAIDDSNTDDDNDANNTNGKIGQLMLEMLGSRPGFAARFCSTLPTADGFVRQLNFPFNDPRKIDAAARMELEAELPSDISQHIIATSPPVAVEEGFITTAATATSQSIAAALQPFDEVNLPLHLLGLSPYAEACGLQHWFSDGFLIQIHEGQLLISLLQHGQVISFERCGWVNPDENDTDDIKLADLINSKTALLYRSARLGQQPLCLIGDGVTATLNESLTQHGLELVELALLDENQEVIDSAFLPVCARAMAANQATLNFRRGPFTLKSEWAALKKHLYIGGSLLLVAILIIASTAIHTYHHKTGIAANYRQQIGQIFRQTLPESKVIVDIPRQLQAALNQLKETGQLVGLDKSTSALSVLQILSSHTPADLKVDIKKFNYQPQILVLDGVTNSFDSVNRLAGELRKATIFGEVRIADAKMGLDGHQVTFRLQLAIGHQGGQK
ncbi:MAG: GspL/Epsl periplasmic domain-containing protein [Thermodesulfobacteriota bacterium]|nr:GspL/Epsl periplasmic domain-containing protein [Thermodesulfobacteriota bacterium]